MLRWTANLALGVSLAATSPVVEPAPQPDWIVSLHARRALWKDPNLSDMNLGVRVRDGVALIWGPVFNEQQANEAVARVRLVPGITSVVNELYVLPADDVLRQRFRPLEKPVPEATPVARSKEQQSKTVGLGVRPLMSTTQELIDDIRRRDARFQNLRVSLINGVIEIGGPADVAAEFAERVRRLSGVNGVRLAPQR